MKRETVNKIRYVLEELLPPVLHDSRFMVFLYKFKFGNLMEELAEFRRRAPFLSDAEYRHIYEQHPRIMEDTDNSEACIQAIAEALLPGSVCDIGCGTGHLLRRIQTAREDIDSFTGLDFMLEPEQRAATDIDYHEAPVEQLPFADNQFDNVICTHVLEHILDIGQAVAELRRITAKRLIIVVPREREYLYTFNPHFHFFPFLHSFLRVMRPKPDQYQIRDIQRDIFYVEDQLGSETA